MIHARTLLVLSALAALPALAATEPAPAGERPPHAANDSALDELRAGRAWHAARILRAAGAAEGPPEDVLLLARAEAGWKNHAAVRRLLEGAEWLDDAGDGAGWALLGRAYEEAGAWQDAATAYASYLVSPASGADPLVGGVQARRARSLARAGALPEALAVLDAVPEDAATLRSWAAVELAGGAAEQGDTAAVAQLLARVGEDAAHGATWRLLADARLAAGDSAGALGAFRAAWDDETGTRRGVAGVESGLLLLAAGDSTGAASLLRAALDDAPRRAAGRAAAALLRIADPDLELALVLSRLLDRAGDGRSALRAYDRAERLAPDGAAGLPEAARLARARLMGTVRSRRAAAIEEHRAIADATTDPAIGARNLEVWAGVRRRQGMDAHVATLRRWLVERYPASPQAAEVVWARGFNAESRGDLDAALTHYAAVADGARTHARAGQARMRSGQIQLGRGSLAEAADVYEAYLEDFPEGRRWEEASYWAARTRLELGDTAAARRYLVRVRSEAPLSYYAVMGADLLGEPYGLDVPEGPAPAEPGWLTEGLRRLDLLEAAGLVAGAATTEGMLVARAAGSAQVTLRLAEALIERGRAIAGINLGWALREEGYAWDGRLLRVVYPFPYREMVQREAAEWGVDPIMMAALIRQESAFDAGIVSRAGAIGLMQVMPPTGRELARAHGPRGFHESALTTPEVNLHLGAAFFRDMHRRYDGELLLVLSAYNAGPTRATRWRRYPERADPLRFTERIPFAETRGYVKNVRRNVGVYRVLYGQD